LTIKTTRTISCFRYLKVTPMMKPIRIKYFKKAAGNPPQISGVFSVTGVQVGCKRQSPFGQSVLSGAWTSPINLSKGFGANSNPLAKT